MGCARVRPRSGRWKRVSFLAALAGTALAGGVAAPEPARTMLVFPARGHWMLEPLREKVSAALPEALRQAGFEVVTARTDSPLVPLAVHDRLIVGEITPARLEEARYALAVLGGLDAVLTAEVTAADGGAALQAELAGSVSERPVKLSVPAPSTDPSSAPELAKQLAAAITPEVWQQAGADAEGRRAAAAERYAAGQQAMAAGRPAQAVEQFGAALAVEGENPEYLRAAAQAESAAGDVEAALTHLLALARVKPDEVEARLALGEAALRAGRPEVAEPAFRAADKMRADDARAVEGLARTYRAEGSFAASREQYQRLIALIPALGAEPASLADVLAGLHGDGIIFAGLPPEQIAPKLALLYLQERSPERGIDTLYRYHKETERPAYSDQDYLTIAHQLDAEAESLAREAEALLRLASPSDPDDAGMEKGLDDAHDRSDRLADLSEMVRVSEREDAAHRYRVLAYNLLNESNFEALLYARTNDAAHERRASLLRDASRKAITDAVTLEVIPPPGPGGQAPPAPALPSG